MNSTRLRVGIVGLGIHGESLLFACLAEPQIDVVAVCQRNREALQNCLEKWNIKRGYDNYAAMFAEEQLDVAVVAVSHGNLMTVAVAAGAARIPYIYVEKPMATTAAEGQRVLDACRHSELVVGYTRRYRSHWVAAERWVREGRLGEDLRGTIHWCDRYMVRYTGREVEGVRPLAADSVGGVLLDHGSHMLDGLLWLTQSRIERVSAAMVRRGPSVDVATALIMEGSRGELYSGVVFPSALGPSQRRIALEGSRGRLVVDDEVATLEADGVSLTAQLEPNGDGHLSDLLRIKDGHRPTASSGADALEVLRIVDAAERSAREHAASVVER